MFKVQMQAHVQRGMEKVVDEAVQQAVKMLAKRYGFDESEAQEFLGVAPTTLLHSEQSTSAETDSTEPSVPSNAAQCSPDTLELRRTAVPVVGSEACGPQGCPTRGRVLSRNPSKAGLDVDELPRLVFIGCTGCGKSSLCSALTGQLRSSSPFKVGNGAKSETSECSVQDFHWFGDDEQDKVKLIDTPGLNDSEGGDEHHIKQIIDTMKKLDYVSAIVLVLNGTEPRFSQSLQVMIARFETVFASNGESDCNGRENFYDNLVICFQRWKMDPVSVADREEDGITEIGTSENFIDQFREKFLQCKQHAKPLPCVFVDSHDRNSDRRKESLLKLKEAIPSDVFRTGDLEQIVPRLVGFDATEQVFASGNPILPMKPVLVDARVKVIKWHISPTLPAGLLMCPDAGIITGTPATPTAKVCYTVEAESLGGKSKPFVIKDIEVMLSDALIAQKVQEYRAKFVATVAVISKQSEPTDEPSLDDLLKKISAASIDCVADAQAQLKMEFGQKHQLIKIGKQIKLGIDEAQTSCQIELKDKYHRFARKGLETKLALHKAKQALQQLMLQGSEDYRVFRRHVQILENLGPSAGSDEADTLAMAQEHMKAIKPMPCPNNGCPCICLARLLPDHERRCLFKLPLLTQEAVVRTTAMDCSGGFVLKAVTATHGRSSAAESDSEAGSDLEAGPDLQAEKEPDSGAETGHQLCRMSTADELAAAVAMSAEEFKSELAADVQKLQDLTQATTTACNRALTLADGDLAKACSLIFDGVVPIDSGLVDLKDFEGTYVPGPCEHIDDDQPHWFHRVDGENDRIIRFKGSARPSAFYSGKRKEEKEWVMTIWQNPYDEQVIATGTKSEKIDGTKFDDLLMTPVSTLSWASWITTKGILHTESVKILYFGGQWCPYCPPFTAKLKVFFEVARKCFGETAVQVIFVSSDRTSDDMLNYFGSRHGDWFCIPYEQQWLKDSLKERFKARHIPSVHVLDDFGDAVAYFREDGEDDNHNEHSFGDAIRHMPMTNPVNYVRAVYKELKDNIPSNDKGFLPREERNAIKEAMKREGCGHGNLVGEVKDFRSGEFKHAACGLRHYLQVAEDWDETRECTETGMKAEVARLKNCPECVSRQALILEEMGKSAHAEATKDLAACLTKLKQAETIAHQYKVGKLAQRSHSGQPDGSNDDAAREAACTAKQVIEDMEKQIEAIRSMMTRKGFWFYGCEQTATESTATEIFEVGPIWDNVEAADKANAWIEQNKPGEGYKFTGQWNSEGGTSFCEFVKASVLAPEWPHEHVQKPYGKFKQPLCQSCDLYHLDYTTIASDLHYVLHEAASEAKFGNQVRDEGRSGKTLDDFALAPEAALLSREQVASLRFYTSNSYDAINTALRDHKRDGAHPLPAITMNIQRGIKHLRAVGATDAAALEELILWRGFKDTQVSEEFNDKGGTELAPMSTTLDVAVAVGYATESGCSGSALMFRIVTENNLQRGAGLSWVSMFPGEAEILYPPLTFVQATGRTELLTNEDFTLTVFEVKTIIP